MDTTLLPKKEPPREALDGRYRFRTSLRCEGVGLLDCVIDLQTGWRKMVRWLPLEVNRHSNQNIVHFCVNLPNHPCLPEVHEVGELESWAYMVIDFPEGELLGARSGCLKPQEWREMACQLSGALSVLHGAQVTHGELCMGSVMLLGPQQYMLWEVQLVLSSRMADRRQGERMLQQLARTVSSMAPERARGGPLTPEVDVYALGTLLAYSAGSHSVASNSTLAIAHAVATEAFIPRIPEALPPNYRHMLERMLAPQAADRPSMREAEGFFAELNVASRATGPQLSEGRAVGGRPHAAHPPPRPRHSSATLPRVAPPAPPAPRAPTVSGVDWLDMLKEGKAAPRPEKAGAKAGKRP